MANRIDRELQSRERESRARATYVPPQQLADPEPQDGYKFRWVRTAIRPMHVTFLCVVVKDMSL